MVSALSEVPAGRRLLSRARNLSLTWALLGTVIALDAASIVLAIVGHLSPAEALSDYLIATLAVGLTMASVGAVIALKRPGQRLGWLMIAIAIGAAVPAFASQYARQALVTNPGSLPFGELAAFVAGCIWPISDSLILVGLPLLFPSGHVLARQWMIVGWVGGLGTALLVAGLALSPGPLGNVPEVDNPIAIDAPWAPALQPIGTALVTTALIAGVVSLILRYRTATARARLQIRAFLVASVLAVLGEVAVPAMIAVLGIPLDDWIFAIIEGVVEPGLAIAIGVAVLRHHLHGIDVLVNRTAVYTVMTALVVGSYALVVGYLSLTVGIQGYIPQFIATVLVALLFHPVRGWVQRGIDRLFYGQRNEPYAILSLLGQRLAGAQSAESVLTAIAQTMREGLRIPFVSVRLEAQPDAGVGVGTPLPIALRLPLTFGANVVGELGIAARSPGQSYRAAELRIIEDYARQAGVAVYAVQLAGELDGARSRLVHAGEDERRRLRRDLHDGVGAQLGSQAIALDAARRLIHSDPARAERVLRELRGNAQRAIDDLRGIINDLRPPVLDDRGLAAAIREQAALHRTDGFTVRVDALADLPAMSAAAEVAVLRIASEAIANAARHSGGSGCVLTLAAARGAITVEVIDDGSGIRTPHRVGVGLASIRERAAEVGGWSEIGPAAERGTRVLATIPLGSAS